MDERESGGTPPDGRREYLSTTYHPDWLPGCDSFTNTSPDPGNWSFAELDTSDYWDWAVIQKQETDGLDATTNYLNSHSPGLAIQINSAYRNPAKEYRVAQQNGVRYAPDSRHMKGDGVDIASNSGNWQQFHDAAKLGASACVEPYQLQGNQAHVHADWRVQDTNKGIPGPTACPTEPYPW